MRCEVRARPGGFVRFAGAAGPGRTDAMGMQTDPVAEYEAALMAWLELQAHPVHAEIDAAAARLAAARARLD